MAPGLPGTKRMLRVRAIFKMRTASLAQNPRILKRSQKIQKKASQIMSIKTILMTLMPAKSSARKV